MLCSARTALICADVMAWEMSEEELPAAVEPIRLPSVGDAMAAGTAKEATARDATRTVERLRERETVMFTQDSRSVLRGSFGRITLLYFLSGSLRRSLSGIDRPYPRSRAFHLTTNRHCPGVAL